MPLLTAQSRSYSEVKPYASYEFANQHKAGWKAFWEEMDGDKEKILDFAKKAEIAHPETWYQELHKFLFDFFSGDPSLIKTASASDFTAYLTQIAENHVKNPKDKWWYIDRGLTEQKFIAVMERASAVVPQENAISFINARIKDLGTYLYSEFLLAKSGNLKELKSVADNMLKKAAALEKEAGEDILKVLEPGTEIKHELFPDDSFTVEDVDGDSIVATDQKGHVAYILDPWNVSIA